MPKIDVVTPEEIARMITESSGVHITGRTVWEKARRIGVAKKMGRTPLIAISDIPLLLEEEDKKAHMRERIDAAENERTLRALRKFRKKNPIKPT